MFLASLVVTVIFRFYWTATERRGGFDVAYLPFILFQQAHLCSVFLVVILSETLTGLHREITQASVDVTIEKVQRWLKSHVRMLDFVEEISGMVRLIFFTTYVSDVLNVIGSLAFFPSSELITSNLSSRSVTSSVNIICYS
ncbi:hypothetical protein BV898_18630 [Hypsibius exemplaris]|uniref:Uncharacterized protein n=1 Tax=Hypsibius exemplaris TaxID=2072580 RepID=A0A9X6NQH5_HYPEX|nr:hypothetical protein BV898_18630 [Hypsibius exemplaris]